MIIFTAKGLNASPADKLDCNFEESCWVEIVLRSNYTLFVACIYRSPKSDCPKSDCGNYILISMTSTISKTLEAIISDYMMEHIVENGLLSPYQHSLLVVSCNTQLLKCLDIVIYILDEGGGGWGIDVVYLEFAKAFGSVPPQRLQSKLKAYEITDQPLKWSERFLTNRRQKSL